METQEVHDMVGKIREFSQFVSDALVNASTLADTVKQLQGEIDSVRSSFEGRISSMQSELDSLRANNNHLEETINHVRSERDLAQEEVGKLRQEVAEVTNARDIAMKDNEQLHNELLELQQKLNDTKRAHDEAEYRALHWEEQHANVSGMLSKVQQALGVAAPLPTVQEGPTEAPRVQATGTGW